MRTIDTLLFIGGIADGHRRAVMPEEDRVHFEQYEWPRVAAGTPEAKPLRKPVYDYRRVTFAGDQADFMFWIADDMTVDEALEDLFSKYPSKNPLSIL